MEGYLEEVTFEQQGGNRNGMVREIITANNVSVPVLSVRQCSKGFIWILH